jgi:hypothetical protein
MRRWFAVLGLLGACSSFDEGESGSTDATPDGGGPADATAENASESAAPDAAGDASVSCTGALVCYDFEDAALPVVSPPADRAEHGVDDVTSKSPTHSFWVRTLPVDSGMATAFVPTIIDVPTGAFELSFALRVDSVSGGSNPQLEVVRVNVTNDYQLEMVYDTGAGGKIHVLERNGCKPGGFRFDPNDNPIVPFGLGTWATVKLVVTSMATTVLDSGATATHLANAFIDGALFVRDFPLCEPVMRTPAALRFGLETSSSNPPFGWSVRFDDIVLFAR